MWRFGFLVTAIALLACTGAATPEPEPEPEIVDPVETPDPGDGREARERRERKEKRKNGGGEDRDDRPVRDAAPVVGPLDKEHAGCGCGLKRGSDTVFATSATGEDAWMNLDGRDVTFRRTSKDEHSELRKPGKIGIETFEADDVEATLTWRVIKPCGGSEENCKDLGLEADFEVDRNGKVTTLTAQGGCGC